MAGRIVYEVASLVSATAADKLAECMEDGDSEHSEQINYRSSLLLALVASETEKNTSKEELVAYLERFYDLIHNPSTPPPPPPKRTESGEIRIEIRLPPN
jgi:hypothetical protein